MLPPSYAMTSGQPFAGAVPLGNVIVGAKLIDLPALVTVMLSVPFVPLFENDAVTDCGGPGSAPAS